MEQTVEDCRGHGAVAKVAPPVLDDMVGCDEDASTLLVALMDQGLQQFGSSIGKSSTISSGTRTNCWNLRS